MGSIFGKCFSRNKKDSNTDVGKKNKDKPQAPAQ